MKLIKKVLLLTIIVLGIVLPIKSFAALSEEQVNAVVNVAREIVNTGNEKGILRYSRRSSHRMSGYNFKLITDSELPFTVSNGERVYGSSNIKGCMGFDCSSFCSAVYKFALKTNFSFSSTVFKNSSMFETYDINDAQPGDVLWKEGHVGIYLGDNMVAEASGMNGKGPREQVIISTNGITKFTRALRMKDEEARKYTDVNTMLVWPDGDESDVWKPGEGGEEEETEEGNTNLGNIEIDEDGHITYNNFPESEFYYNGLPEKRWYGGRIDFGEWVFNLLTDVLDWIIGILLMGAKIQLVGWTKVIENFVTSIVGAVSSVTLTEKLTIESIVYNRVALLDANIFNFATAGGQALTSGSVLYILRQQIASWYYVLHITSVIGMLVTLIYTGIKVAISTIAEQRAKYKSMLLQWLIGFIILFSLPYIMIFIMHVNEALIGIFANLSNDITLYDKLMEYIYMIPASVSWMATIVYVVLVYYMFKYLFMYLKRFLVICILTFMSPIMALTYCVDKIKGNKSKIKLTNWLKEYVFNVLIQFIHAMLYTIFLTVELKLIESTNLTVIISSMVIGFVFLNFMLKAEKLFKKIFKIGGSGSTLKDVVESTANIMGGIYMAKEIASVSNKYSPAGIAIRKGIKFGDSTLEKRYINTQLKLRNQENNTGTSSMMSTSIIGTAGTSGNAQTGTQTGIGSLVNTENSTNTSNTGANTVGTSDDTNSININNAQTGNSNNQNVNINNTGNTNNRESFNNSNTYVPKATTITDIDQKINDNLAKEYRAKKQLYQNLAKAGASSVYRKVRILAAIPMIISNPVQGTLDIYNYTSNKAYTRRDFSRTLEEIDEGKGSIGVKTLKKGTHFIATKATRGENYRLKKTLEKEKGKIDKEISEPTQVLFEARDAEIQLIDAKENLKKSNHPLFANKKLNPSQLDEAIAGKYREKLKENLEDVFKDVAPKEKVKAKVVKHMKQNNFAGVQLKDLPNIAAELNITVTPEFSRNLDAEEIARMDVNQLTNVLNEKLNDRRNRQIAPVIKEFDPIVKQAIRLKEANEKSKRIGKVELYKNYDELIQKILS